MRTPVLRTFLALAFAATLAAQSGDSSKSVKPAPTGPVVGSGEYLFKSYCSSCHGLDGKGSGPVADSMRMKPSDLTLLARKNGGKFPAYRVEKLLGGAEGLPAHGTLQMPVWGPGLRDVKPDGGQSAKRISNLLAFLESIQTK
jgi:mono/diheme cytochrome c family protein